MYGGGGGVYSLVAAFVLARVIKHGRDLAYANPTAVIYEACAFLACNNETILA